MYNIEFSKMAFEDLCAFKEEIVNRDSVKAMVYLNMLIDQIYDIGEEDFSHQVFEEDFFFYEVLDHIVFYKREDQIKIVRILEKNKYLLRAIYGPESDLNQEEIHDCKG